MSGAGLENVMNNDDFSGNWDDEPTRGDIAIVTTEKPAAQYHEVAHDFFREFEEFQVRFRGRSELARAATVEIPCIDDEVSK